MQENKQGSVLPSAESDNRMSAGSSAKTAIERPQEDQREADWSWDAATDLVMLGPETARAFGLTPGAAITWEALRESLHPEDRERTQKAVRHALETGGDYQVEYRVRRGPRYVWIAAKGHAIHREDGSIQGIRGVVQDITRQKETEEIRSRLAAVVESSDDAIISISLDTTILTWNKGAERMFGYTSEEVVGRSVSMLIP